LINEVSEQSALRGLLARIRDLGLALLSVTRAGHRETLEEDVQDGAVTQSKRCGPSCGQSVDTAQPGVCDRV